MSNAEINIKLNYLYRDGGNYKVWGYEVFSNPDLLSIKGIEEKIRESLIGGEFFDPQHWKVTRLKFDDLVSELDHTWNEFDSLAVTAEEPTNSNSITEFLKAIRNAPKH